MFSNVIAVVYPDPITRWGRGVEGFGGVNGGKSWAVGIVRVCVCLTGGGGGGTCRSKDVRDPSGLICFLDKEGGEG